jgi:hypothetical protein
MKDLDMPGCREGLNLSVSMLRNRCERPSPKQGFWLLPPFIETVSHHFSRFAGFVPRVAQTLDPAGWFLAVQLYGKQVRGLLSAL